LFWKKKAPLILGTDPGYVDIKRKSNFLYKIYSVIKQNKQWLHIPRRQMGREKNAGGLFLTKMLYMNDGKNTIAVVPRDQYAFLSKNEKKIQIKGPKRKF